MAALIQALVISGSRLSTGEPNDTGVVYAYQPGTTSPAILYADPDAATVITQPIVLDNGGRIPYDTYPDGVWITAPIRLLVQDVSGQTVTDSTYWTSDARTDALVNDGWTGDTVDEALTAIFASVGGQDGQYQESGGATPRPIQDKFREQGIWVTDFGAVGNGIAIDTTAIQTAANRAKALSCALRFPAGTFKIDQSITITSATGVRIIGAGQAATTIVQSNGAGIGFSFTTCTDCSVEDMTVSAVTTSSNVGVGFTDAVRPTVRNVTIAGSTVPAGFAFGVSIDGTGSATGALVQNCILNGTTNGLFLSDVITVNVTNCTLNSNSGDAALSLNNTCLLITVIGCQFFTSATGVNFGSGTVTNVVIVGCPTLGSNTGTPMDMSGLAADPILFQVGNRVDRATYSAAVGNTLTILISKGLSPNLVAASGGAGTMTVAAPVPTPSTSATAPAVYLDILFKNGSGGAVTWSMNAAFVQVGGVAPVGTDGTTVAMRYRWDIGSSKWRECYRATTTT